MHLLLSAFARILAADFTLRRSRLLKGLMVGFCTALSFLASRAQAQFTLQPVLQEVILNAPVDLQFLDDGSNRLFVVERDGRILAVENYARGGAAQVFLDIRDRVHASVEEGLLGLAFHPDFDDDGRFFVYYVADKPRRSVLASFELSESDPNYADPESQNVLLEFEQPYPQHQAGQLRFGPDGYLYIATGDGGGFSENRGTGEDLTTLFGSILRIDVDQSSGGRHYAIPAGNPFAGNDEGFRQEIWAYGLRNPWRFSFDKNVFATPDRSDSLRIWAADVGSGSYEEVNLVEKGKNYGWSAMEGIRCHGLEPNCDPSGRTPPVWEYGHDLGTAVIGGFVYRGSKMPSLEGRYIYGDFTSGRVWALTSVGDTTWNNEELLRADSIRMFTFGEDVDGELYVAGAVQRRAVIYKLATDQISDMDDEQLPTAVVLGGNHPNPFQGETVISYTLSRSASVELTVYDALGREVSTLVDEFRPPGIDHVVWKGTDESGRSVAPGLYLYRLVTDGRSTAEGQMILVR